MKRKRKSGISGSMLFGLGAGALYTAIRNANEKRQSNTKLRENILAFNNYVSNFQKSAENHFDFSDLDKCIELNSPTKNYDAIIKFIEKEIEINKANEVLCKELWYRPMDINDGVDINKITNRISKITENMSEFPIGMSQYLWIRNRSLESIKKTFNELKGTKAEFNGEHKEYYDSNKDDMYDYYTQEVKKGYKKFEKSLARLGLLISN